MHFEVIVGKKTNKMIISTTFCTILLVNKFWQIISVLFSLSFEIRAALEQEKQKLQCFWISAVTFIGTLVHIREQLKHFLEHCCFNFYVSNRNGKGHQGFRRDLEKSWRIHWGSVGEKVLAYWRKIFYQEETMKKSVLLVRRYFLKTISLQFFIDRFPCCRLLLCCCVKVGK